MSVNILTYMLAASLIQGGMNWKQAIVTIFIGNVIVLVPMLLNSHPGAKYGIPFPVLARASFGVLGANVAAVSCAHSSPADGSAFRPGSAAKPSAPCSRRSCPSWKNFPYGAAVCFFIFWLINLAVVSEGHRIHPDAARHQRAGPSWRRPASAGMGLPRPPADLARCSPCHRNSQPFQIS